MTENEITGKQILSDCATLVKHLCVYTVHVTKRVYRSIKHLVSKPRKSEKSDDGAITTDTTPT